MRLLLSLPFLPSAHIKQQFQIIKEYLEECNELSQLISYIENTWIESTIWPPSSWSCFKRAIHTNNDLEGFHQKFNSSFGIKTSFYTIVEKLKHEADLINVFEKLLSEKKICRNQRKIYKHLQKKLFEAWESFERSEMNVAQLLEVCCSIYHP